MKGGVKTLEGKNISRWNAQKHGILRQSLMSDEEERFNKIHEMFNEELQPIGVIEKVLVERLTLLYLKLKRVSVAETEYLKSLLNPKVIEAKYINGFETLNIVTTTEKVISEGFKPALPDETFDYLGRTYSRYEEVTERRFYKALRELQRLQLIRRGEIVPAAIFSA